MKICSFAWNIGCYPSLQLSQKIDPTSWSFEGKLLRIDGDIDNMCSFAWNIGLLPLIVILMKN